MFTFDVFSPNGAMQLTNCGGIEIELSPCGDGVRYRFRYGQDPLDNPVETEIQYLPNPDFAGADDPDGGLSPAFMVGDTAYFLDNFMAI